MCRKLWKQHWVSKMTPHQCKKQAEPKTVTFLSQLLDSQKRQFQFGVTTLIPSTFSPAADRWQFPCHLWPTATQRPHPALCWAESTRGGSPRRPLTEQKSQGAPPHPIFLPLTPGSLLQPPGRAQAALQRGQRLPAASPEAGPTAPQPGAPSPSLTLLRPGARQRDEEEEEEEGAEAEQRGRLPDPRGERPPRAHHAPGCSAGMAGSAGRAGAASLPLRPAAADGRASAAAARPLRPAQWLPGSPLPAARPRSGPRCNFSESSSGLLFLPPPERAVEAKQPRGRECCERGRMKRSPLPAHKRGAGCTQAGDWLRSLQTSPFPCSSVACL